VSSYSNDVAEVDMGGDQVDKPTIESHLADNRTLHRHDPMKKVPAALASGDVLQTGDEVQVQAGKPSNAVVESQNQGQEGSDVQETYKGGRNVTTKSPDTRSRTWSMASFEQCQLQDNALLQKKPKGSGEKDANKVGKGTKKPKKRTRITPFGWYVSILGETVGARILIFFALDFKFVLKPEV
jgi:hypothetical protein